MHTSLKPHSPRASSEPLVVTTVFATDAGGIDPFAAIPRAALAAFFESVRRFVLAEPWDVLGHVPVGIDVPALGLVGGCVLMLGDRRGPRGLALFPSYEAFEAFERVAHEAEPQIGVGFTLVELFSLHELCGAAIARVANDGLPLADEDSYAVPDVLDEHGASLTLSKGDVDLVGTVLSRLAELITHHRSQLDGSTVLNAFLQSPGVPVAVVEHPHARWFDAHLP